jgi:ligand-binding sensor domain-containing protein/signal transduction histidine kinase
MPAHHTPNRAYKVPTPNRGYGVPKQAILLLLGAAALFGSALALPLPPANVQSRHLGGEAHGSGTALSGARQVQTADESAPAVIAARDPQTQEDLPPASIRFERISIEQGLSFSVVQSILQDRQGFLWVGTGRGLDKYDGYQFTVYRNDPADPRSLSNDSVDALYEDSAGELWVGTDVGLDRLDRSTGTFVHYQDGLEAASINAIYEDRNGVLWVGSGAGLYYLNRNTQEFIFAPTRQVVTGMAEDADGRLWVSGSFGVYWLDPETGQGTLPRLNTQWISAVCVDAQGDLWVGAEDGLRRLDRSTDAFVRYQHDPDDPLSLIDNRVQALLEDSAGRLWVGTRGGLDLFDRKQNRFIHYQYDPYNPHSLSDDLVLRLYEDRSGVLWVGTLRGLSKYSWAADRFTLYTRLPDVPVDTGGTLETSGLQSLSDDRVIAVREDRSGNVWVGMYEGGLNRLDRTAGRVTVYRHNPADSSTLSSDIVRAVYEDRSGTLWVGTDSRLERFEPDSRRLGRDSNGTFLKNWGLNQLPRERVFAIAEDHAGELWVGTQANLYSFDRESGAFMPYRQLGLSYPAVESIYGDEAGLLWVGTLGGGLYQWDGTRFISYQPRHPAAPPSARSAVASNVPNGTLEAVAESTGRSTEQRGTEYPPQAENAHSLSSDYVLSIYTDLTFDSGAVWVGTLTGGLLRFDRANPGGEFTQYTEKDGLSGDRVACIQADANGFLWLGTNRGVSKFDPKSKTFRNYDARDGLQSGEFIGCSQSGRGEMFFGGLGGLNAFYPGQVKDNLQPPPVAITVLTLLNEAQPMSLPVDGRIQLSYQQNDLSFEFAALDYHASGKNQYAYRLEGVNRDWVYAGTRRYADYTNLRPGKYVFRVKGSNNDGVWNEEGVTLHITIRPPFWGTWWFLSLVGLVLLVSGYSAYRIRIRRIEAQRNELENQVKERTDEINQRRKELEALYQADENLYRHLDLEQVLQALIDTALHLLNADKGSVLCWDDKKENLVIRAARNFQPQTIANTRIPHGKGIAGKVAQSGVTAIVEDTAQDASVTHSIVQPENIRAFIQVPIKVENEVFGVFSADYTSPRSFKEDEIRLLLALAQRAGIAIQNARLYEQSHQLAVLEERSRLARELHDAVTQTLFSASLIAEVLPQLWQRNRDEALRRLEELRQLNRGALAEMRTLLLELRPAALEKAELHDLLRQLAEALRSRAGLAVAVEADEACSLPVEVKVAFYRIAQEALNNVVKHAQANQVNVRLRCEAGTVGLEIADDGQGFDPTEVSVEHHGLRIMRERAEAIGAQVQVNSRGVQLNSPTHGTQVLVTWNMDSGQRLGSTAKGEEP